MGGVHLAHRGGLDYSLAVLFITPSFLLFFFPSLFLLLLLLLLRSSREDNDKQSRGTSCRASESVRGPARRPRGATRDKLRRRSLALTRSDGENMTRGGTSVNDLALTRRQRWRQQRSYGG